MPWPRMPAPRVASAPPILALIPALLAALLAIPAGGEELPGEEISESERQVERSQARVLEAPSARAAGANWLAPSIDEQLGRDETLIPLGKGALFVPSYSEPRREPEVTVETPEGREVTAGRTGERILLDSGQYVVRYGSGTANQQLRFKARIDEGHVTVLPPTWGSLIVETLGKEGEYIDEQYEVTHLRTGESYGRGHGLKEERLQDIKAWVLPAGNYRLSRVGEAIGSLTNYITVQVNSGDLTMVELIYDRATDAIIAGGVKALQTRRSVGRSWTLGLRAGGNVNLFREVNETDVSREGMIIATDARTRLRFDNTLYFGLSEILLQTNFIKNEGNPLTVTSDNLQARSTWVRRLNNWMGPYVRGQVTTHFFPVKSPLDTVYLVDAAEDGGFDTLETVTGGGFEFKPPFYPVLLAQGLGANLELLSRYALELSTQLGIGAHQQIWGRSYLARSASEFQRAEDVYEIGLENIINMHVRLGSMLTLDLRTELFAPEGNIGDMQLVDLTTDLRLHLTRNVELAYVFRMQELKEEVNNRYPRDHNLSLRVSYNF